MRLPKIARDYVEERMDYAAKSAARTCGGYEEYFYEHFTDNINGLLAQVKNQRLHTYLLSEAEKSTCYLGYAKMKPVDARGAPFRTKGRRLEQKAEPSKAQPSREAWFAAPPPPVPADSKPMVDAEYARIKQYNLENKMEARKPSLLDRFRSSNRAQPAPKREPPARSR